MILDLRCTSASRAVVWATKGYADSSSALRPYQSFEIVLTGGHLLGVVRGQPLQHAPHGPGPEGEGGRPRGRHGGHALQHDRSQRRYLHGHRRNELQPSVA
eukprot:9333022-Pyramimonas_sp.AAC.2